LNNQIICGEENSFDITCSNYGNRGMGAGYNSSKKIIGQAGQEKCTS
jgi:hypothetical protein